MIYNLKLLVVSTISISLFIEHYIDALSHSCDIVVVEITQKDSTLTRKDSALTRKDRTLTRKDIFFGAYLLLYNKTVFRQLDHTRV